MLIIKAKEENTMFYKIYDFEIGRILIVEDRNYIIRVKILNDESYYLDEKIFKVGTKKETMLIRKTKLELIEYFAGKRKTFDIPIKLNGTDFQVKVWKELLKVPYGKTCTYLDIAKKIENPNAARAVGMANNKNNIQIIIPCHRVIGSNKKLIGYAGGIKVKERLLKLERDNL